MNPNPEGGRYKRQNHNQEYYQEDDYGGGR